MKSLGGCDSAEMRSPAIRSTAHTPVHLCILLLHVGVAVKWTTVISFIDFVKMDRAKGKIETARWRYENFVINSPDKASQVESFARLSSYIIPGECILEDLSPIKWSCVCTCMDFNHLSLRNYGKFKDIFMFLYWLVVAYMDLHKLWLR